VRVNRERQGRSEGVPRTESIREAVLKLKENGLTAEQMQALIQRIDVCPTLTAHPTEARRRAVLDKLQRVAEGWRSSRSRFPRRVWTGPFPPAGATKACFFGR
jgi:phosphoenolpyruvate carboxylase